MKSVKPTTTKKMAAGGAAEGDCWPGKPGCGYEKARRKNARRKAMSNAGPVLKKIGSGIATAGAAALAYAKRAPIKKALGIEKNGGAINSIMKKQKGGSTWTDNYGQGVTKTTPTKGGGTKEKSFTTVNGYAGSSSTLTKTKRDAEGTVVKEKTKSISPNRAAKVEKRVESKIQRKGGPVKTMKRGGIVAKKK